MRVLVVEDNRNLVANLFDYFEARGYTLDAAPDGPTGLHLAVTQDFDAIVLDWMLPRMDGREVLSRLRDAGRDVPVLMLTARDELPDKIAGFRAGADDYLTKPFDLPELEVRLEALVARASGRGRSRVLQVGDLRLDLTTLEATRDGQRAAPVSGLPQAAGSADAGQPGRGHARSPGARAVGRRSARRRHAALAHLRTAPQRRRAVRR